MAKAGRTVCPECGVSLKKENLNRHINKVHTEMPGELAPGGSKGGTPKAEGAPLLWLWVAVVCIILLSFALYPFLKDDEDGNDGEGGAGASSRAIMRVERDGNIQTIVIDLHTDKAPDTCANFKRYVKNGFYEGMMFHRVINNFMMQTGGYYRGDSDEITYKEPNYPPINLETSPGLRHVDGAVAMARTTEPNSATSQFYICDGPQGDLDDQYAVFGQVVSGMEVVRQIASTKTQAETPFSSDVPVNDITIISITLQ